MTAILVGVAAACGTGFFFFFLVAAAMWRDQQRHNSHDELADRMYRPVDTVRVAGTIDLRWAAQAARIVHHPSHIEVPDHVPWGLEALTGEMTDTIPDHQPRRHADDQDR